MSSPVVALNPASAAAFAAVSSVATSSESPHSSPTLHAQLIPAQPHADTSNTAAALNPPSSSLFKAPPLVRSRRSAAGGSPSTTPVDPAPTLPRSTAGSTAAAAGAAAMLPSLTSLTSGAVSFPGAAALVSHAALPPAPSVAVQASLDALPASHPAVAAARRVSLGMLQLEDSLQPSIPQRRNSTGKRVQWKDATGHRLCTSVVFEEHHPPALCSSSNSASYAASQETSK